jgi:mannose/fructose/N-acetylgalactosamine-specific phosphotransferase system component IIC
VNWILLGLIGGVVGLDSTSFPQAMWSRPLVAATAAGLVFGKPMSGLAVGALLEIFAILILPFGAARYPESGTAAAAGAAAFAVTDVAALDPRLLLVSVVFGLTWEHVAGASVIFVRRLNGRLVALPPNDGYSGRQVTQRHLLAMAIDFVRGAWAVLVGAILGILLLRSFVALPRFDEGFGFETGVLIVAAAVMMGSALTLFGGLRARATSLGLGLLCGLLLLLLQ